MNWILTKIGVRHSTIRKLAAGRTPKKLFKLLCREQEELADAIRYLREARSVIAVDLDFITEGLFADASEIFLRQAAKRRLILGEPNEYRDGVEEFYGALSLFCAEWPHPRTEPRLFIRRLV
ncbi:MAG: hypothetical protein LBT47_07785 [Deltaproteobacteria bacterium]|jgi:hypothetical protein|nr:hypothetical protein [Deltaproteobacteria bacterium]